jgi:tRNA (guanine-N(7)-)-methyltransferase subunit TRM82
MLTDVVAVSLPGPPGSRPRNYILTADRDEHIRVSRGIPQAHVIEQQCFGHTSLISKLCIPSWAPNVLISGGGDGHLLVWNWSEGQVHQSVPLGDSFQDAIISGIWDVSFDQPAGTAGSINIILIGLEGYVSDFEQMKEPLLIGEIAPLSSSAIPSRATTHSSPKALFNYPETCST